MTAAPTPLPATTRSDVLVIGAGMAGVTAARELARAGLKVTVVEAGDRVGGRIRSIRDFCTDPVEGGAEFIHGVDAATWSEVHASDLTTRPCPLIRHTMLDIGHGPRRLPWLMLHPGTWPAATILRSIARFQPPDISAREFIDRRGYRGRARILAEMTLTAHLPGRAEDIGMLGLQEDGLLRLETGLNHRVAEGYDRLSSLIGQDLDIRLSFAVEAVHWGARAVTVRSTDGRELTAGTAVCTLPLGVLASGAVRFEPGLPEDKRSALDDLEMGPVAKILLRFRERFWPRRLANLGCGAGPVILYWPVSYGSRSDSPVLTAYATGPRAARLARVSEDEAAAIAVADLDRLFPKTDVDGALVAHRRVEWVDDPLSCGGYSFVRPGGAGARRRLAAADTGALLWAGSATVSSPIAETVEAAYLSGLRAAAEAMALMET